MAYNGWSNKETWLVNVWLGDMFAMDLDEGIEITEDYIETQVEYFVEQLNPEGFMLDLLNCALGEINYYEIASNYKEEE
jgi:hypothetical protein